MSIFILLLKIIVSAFFLVWSFGVLHVALQSETNKERRMFWFISVAIAAIALAGIAI